MSCGRLAIIEGAPGLLKYYVIEPILYAISNLRPVVLLVGLVENSSKKRFNVGTQRSISFNTLGPPKPKQLQSPKRFGHLGSDEAKIRFRPCPHVSASQVTEITS